MMQNLKEYMKNNKSIPVLIACVLAFGILMMVTSRVYKPPAPPDEGDSGGIFPTVEACSADENPERELEKRLEEIFSLVNGAGRVRVMVSPLGGREWVYAKNANTTQTQTSEKDAQGGTREHRHDQSNEQTVVIGDRPLVLREIAPQVEGIVIIAEGGDCAFVRDALTRAARSILGVEPHRIQVLHMASQP